MENGLPIYLFGAMGIDKRKHSMNIAVPLKTKSLSAKAKAARKQFGNSDNKSIQE